MSHSSKNFQHVTAVYGYIAKLKRALGLPFDAHFMHDFP